MCFRYVWCLTPNGKQHDIIWLQVSLILEEEIKPRVGGLPRTSFTNNFFSRVKLNVARSEVTRVGGGVTSPRVLVWGWDWDWDGALASLNLCRPVVAADLDLGQQQKQTVAKSVEKLTIQKQTALEDGDVQEELQQVLAVQ